MSATLAKSYKTDLEAVKADPLDGRSKYLRSLIFRGFIKGGRGHIGPALSLVETIRVLYDDYLTFDAANPKSENRDRYILSKGHGCLALYAVLADKGFFALDELDRFCHYQSILGGHPEILTPGVEASTGTLGHGLSIGVGIALGLRIKKSPARVFVHMGDGEINEGSVWEAAATAAKHRLKNLIAIIDYNKIQSAGPVSEILDMEPLMDKWAAFGFEVAECNGHNIADLKRGFDELLRSKAQKPGLLITHTVKGKGLPIAEGNAAWHHRSLLSEDELAQIKQVFGDHLHA